MIKPGLFRSNEVSGEELEYLLGDVSVERLVRDHFGKRSLFVKGHPDKFRGLFDRATFERAAQRSALELGDEPPLLRASFARGTQPGQSVGESRLFRIEGDQVRPMYDAGATICADWISNAVPRLRALAQAIKAQLRYPGEVRFNAYLSPDGRGFDAHFDARIATTLQIEGTKVWRYTKTAVVDWPLENAFRMGDGVVRYPGRDYTMSRETRASNEWERPRETTADEWEEVVLEPGDMLMLPAGALHAAKAEGHSLALNLAFEPFRLVDLFHDLLRDALVDRAEWRGTPPIFAPGADPGEAERWLAARLDDVRAVLARLAPSSLELVRPWGRSVVEQAPKGKGSFLRPPSDAPPRRRTIERTDVLALARPDVVCMRGERDGGAVVVLYCGDAEIEVEGPVVAFVERMVSARKFHAEDAAHWSSLSWSEVVATLEAFLEARVLRRADG